MKVNRNTLRRMIMQEAKNLRSAPRKVTAAELRSIIAEEVRNVKKGQMNEGIIDTAIEHIHPMISGPFEDAGYDGDWWADEIIDSLKAAGLADRIRWNIGGLLMNREAQRDLARVLSFDPDEIGQLYPNHGDRVQEVGQDVLRVLQRHGYAT